MFDPIVLGKNIRNQREKKNMTQQELAAELFVSFQAVSAWERGIAVPDLENAAKLAEFFAVKLDTLIRDPDCPLFAAVDGGGTKTEFVLFEKNGTVRKRLVLGGSNPNDIGIDKSIALLREGLDTLLHNTTPDGIFAGIAGSSSADNKKRISEALAKEYCSASFVDSDAVNVLSMGRDPKNAASLICGTGSVVFVRKNYSLTRIGGWGYLFDRSGSGYDIGNDAIRHALAVNDRLTKPTLLSELTQKKLGEKNVWDGISTLYQKGKPYIASFAPVVIESAEKGDSTAKEILKNNAKRLSELIKTARREYGAPEEFVGAGGFLNNGMFKKLVEEYSDTHLYIPDTPPVYGACLECLRLKKLVPEVGFKSAFLETLNK